QGVVNHLRRLHVPRLFAVYLVYLLFLGVAASFAFIFLPFTLSRLAIFIEELPGMVTKLQELVLVLPERYPEIFSEEQVLDWIAAVQSEIRLMAQNILSQSVNSVTRFVSWLIYAVLVPILVFFMLKD